MPFKMMWNPIVPTKVGFFAREVWWGKVLTMNQLKKRGLSLASRCPLCKEVEEAIEYFLIHYPKTWSMWTALINVVGVGWVCSFSVKDLFLGWPSLLWGKKEFKLWCAVPPCLMWTI